MKKRVMIALSGGVDSAVAAYLMKEQGYDCIGATMQLCGDGSGARDAAAIAQQLDIPFIEYDARQLFQQQVIADFISVYRNGGTPNPCVVCNKTMKFGHLLDLAKARGCDYIATGHYAQIIEKDGRFVLQKGPDESKDQSYFLAGLNQEQLSHILFPLGGMSKAQVRQIAEAQGFVNASKKDSQDICFIPDGDYFKFIKSYTGEEFPSGAFLDTDGNTVGTHKNAIAYTLGQRKGLGLAMGAPVYVTGKDMARNTVSVGAEQLLFTDTLIAEDLNWLPFPTLSAPMEVTAKARSRHKAQKATIYPEGDTVKVVFHEPQRALTPGQAVVFYDDDFVIGSGTITKVIY